MIRRAAVVIVGSGAAALRAAIEAPPPVLLITKRGVGDANTFYAQGGVAAAIGEDDAVEIHERDTIEAGRGLADLRAVHSIIAEGPERLEELVRWGARFDRAGGAICLAREGAHSRARVVHRGDRTGREIFRVLWARARPRVELLERTQMVELIVRRGRCCGVVVWNEREGLVPVAAGAVILATGGAGRLFQETTNPDVATGDGIAAAGRAGAELMDLEFVQFHPTALYLAGAPRLLISEAVRGAGAVLRDRGGDAFMGRVHPMADLAPRDDCARAILRRMIETGETHVRLDITPIPRRERRRRFPALDALCARYGLRPDAIPVRPAAHYTIGGVRTDLEGRATIEGLFAAGECAATGFHGANRLGSNSLLECLVMGRRVGAAVAAAKPRAPRRDERLPAATGRAARGDVDVRDLAASLRALMWRHAGLVRDARSLDAALERIRLWRSYAAGALPATGEGWELSGMLMLAEWMVRAARLREESRGVHYRQDFPNPDPAWAVHLVWRDGRVRRERRASPMPPR